MALGPLFDLTHNFLSNLVDLLLLLLTLEFGSTGNLLLVADQLLDLSSRVLK